MDDSEWEYEYHDTESEVLYFTIDLTSHVPPELSTKKAGSKKPNKPLSSTTTIHQRGMNTSDRPEDGASQPEPSTSRMPGIQIVDLHSTNPLISYDNKFYSCHWGTDIGTSILLTKPAEETQPEYLPLRTYRSFDLLGTTRARLMGVPATIKSRIGILETESQPRIVPGPDVDVSTTAEGDYVQYSERQGLRIDLPASAPAEKLHQARFLERFAAAKIKRGERGPVPVKFINQYKHPEGWEGERDEWIAKEIALSERNRQEAEKRAEAIAEMRRQTLATEEAQFEAADEAAVSPEPGSLAHKRQRTGSVVTSEDGDDLESSEPTAKKKRGPTGNPVGRPRQITVAESSIAGAVQDGISESDRLSDEEAGREDTVQPAREAREETLPGN